MIQSHTIVWAMILLGQDRVLPVGLCSCKAADLVEHRAQSFAYKPKPWPLIQPVCAYSLRESLNGIPNDVQKEVLWVSDPLRNINEIPSSQHPWKAPLSPAPVKKARQRAACRCCRTNPLPRAVRGCGTAQEGDVGIPAFLMSGAIHFVDLPAGQKVGAVPGSLYAWC